MLRTSAKTILCLTFIDLPLSPAMCWGPSCALRYFPLAFSFRPAYEIRWFQSEAPSRPGINHHLHGVRRDGLLNRGVGVVQAVAVRDELADRILSHVPGELAHTRPIGGGLFPAHAQDTDVPRAQMPVGVDGHLAQIGEIPRRHEHPTDPEHLERLRNDLRHARAFDDHVRPPAVGQVTDL